jgi:hypothetical protein
MRWGTVPGEFDKMPAALVVGGEASRPAESVDHISAGNGQELRMGHRRRNDADMKLVFIVSLFFALVGCSRQAYHHQGDDKGASGKELIDRLIEKSRQGARLSENEAELDRDRPVIGEQTRQLALDHILSRPDNTSYHLLFLLKTRAPNVYDEIPTEIKARVLSSSLEKAHCLNDWSFLGPDIDCDAEAGRALVELGPSAIEFLIPILDNKHEAALDGSADATMSVVYAFRRADYAYRYISLILGERAVFLPDPEERDVRISELKRRLRPVAQ